MAWHMPFPLAGYGMFYSLLKQILLELPDVAQSVHLLLEASPL